MKKILAIAALLFASMFGSAQAGTLYSFSFIGKAVACTGAAANIPLDSSGSTSWPGATPANGTAPTANFTIQKVGIGYYVDTGGGYQSWFGAYTGGSYAGYLTPLMPGEGNYPGITAQNVIDFGPQGGVPFNYSTESLYVGAFCQSGTGVYNHAVMTIWYTQP